MTYLSAELSCAGRPVCVLVSWVLLLKPGRCWVGQEVEDRLKAELESSLDACTAEVNAFIKPLEEATLAVVERVRDFEIRRAVLADELEQLKQRAASVE